MVSDKYFLLFLLLGISILFTAACDNCVSDEFGPEVALVLPVSVRLPQDTLVVGDTIKIDMDFEKQIEVCDNINSVFLENFEFFTKINFSEISGVEENFDIEIDFFSQVGGIEILPLLTGVAYPITYLETDTSYQFSGSIIVKEAGKYFLYFSTNVNNYERFEHPFVYQCNENRRVTIGVKYSNLNTSIDEFEQIFSSSNIEYFQAYDFDSFSRGAGGRSFVVVEE